MNSIGILLNATYNRHTVVLCSVFIQLAEMSFWVIIKSEGNFIVLHLFHEYFSLIIIIFLKIYHHQNICGQNLEQPWMKWLHIVVGIRDTYQKLAKNRKTNNWKPYCTLHTRFHYYYYFGPAFIGVNCQYGYLIYLDFGLKFYFFSFDTKLTWLNIQWFFILSWI